MFNNLSVNWFSEPNTKEYLSDSIIKEKLSSLKPDRIKYSNWKNVNPNNFLDFKLSINQVITIFKWWEYINWIVTFINYDPDAFIDNRVVSIDFLINWVIQSITFNIDELWTIDTSTFPFEKIYIRKKSKFNIDTSIPNSYHNINLYDTNFLVDSLVDSSKEKLFSVFVWDTSNFWLDEIPEENWNISSITSFNLDDFLRKLYFSKNDFFQKISLKDKSFLDNFMDLFKKNPSLDYSKFNNFFSRGINSVDDWVNERILLGDSVISKLKSLKEKISKWFSFNQIWDTTSVVSKTKKSLFKAFIDTRKKLNTANKRIKFLLNKSEAYKARILDYKKENSSLQWRLFLQESAKNKLIEDISILEAKYQRLKRDSALMKKHLEDKDLEIIELNRTIVSLNTIVSSLKEKWLEIADIDRLRADLALEITKLNDLKHSIGKDKEEINSKLIEFAAREKMLLFKVLLPFYRKWDLIKIWSNSYYILDIELNTITLIDYKNAWMKKKIVISNFDDFKNIELLARNNNEDNNFYSWKKTSKWRNSTSENSEENFSWINSIDRENPLIFENKLKELYNELSSVDKRDIEPLYKYFLCLAFWVDQFKWKFDLKQLSELKRKFNLKYHPDRVDLDSKDLYSSIFAMVNNVYDEYTRILYSSL